MRSTFLLLALSWLSGSAVGLLPDGRGSVRGFAAGRGASPVVVKKVEADWGNLTAGYLAERATVEMTVLPSGIPFSLAATNGSLPDPAVRALAQWRFADQSASSADKALFVILLTVPVRRKLAPDVELAQRPVWSPLPDLEAAIKLGNSMDAAKAAELLGSLPNAEALGNFRTSLLVYYAKQRAGDNDAVRKQRRDLTTWLVRTYPQDNILASSYAMINAAGEPLADADGSAQLRKEWLEAVKQYPKDDAVAAAAASFLRVADPVAALRLVSEREDWSSRSNWLGDIYAYAGLNVSAIAPDTGQAIAAGEPKFSKQGLANSFRQALLDSNDLKLVLSGVATSGALARELTAHHALPEGYAEFCGALMKHVRELYPQSVLSCDPSEPEPHEIPWRTLRIGGNASFNHGKKNVTKKAAKRPAAGEAIPDALEFLALIDASGNVDRLELIKGPLAIYGAALNGLLNWQFSPLVINNTLVPTRAHLLVDLNVTR